MDVSLVGVDRRANAPTTWSLLLQQLIKLRVHVQNEHLRFLRVDTRREDIPEVIFLDVRRILILLSGDDQIQPFATGQF